MAVAVEVEARTLRCKSHGLIECPRSAPLMATVRAKVTSGAVLAPASAPPPGAPPSAPPLPSAPAYATGRKLPSAEPFSAAMLSKCLERSVIMTRRTTSLRSSM